MDKYFVNSSGQMIEDTIGSDNLSIKNTNSNNSSDSGKLLWEKCQKIIKDNVSPQVYKTWFTPIKALKWEASLLTLSVPSQFFFEWIEEHYFDLMNKTISQIFGEKAKVQYQIIFDDYEDTHEPKSIKLPGLKNNSRANQNTLPFEPVTIESREFPSFLNQRYSFDNFITGDSNQLAYSAALAVSQNPAKTRFNPLVLYGDTGLGKTHLVQAIGNYITSNFPRMRTLYTNSERFTMEFISAIQNNKSNEFVNFYRSVDVLIVDDIQFFAGKEKTQDNFFHTFNALYQAGKQLILTSDKAPGELKDVDDRLISRFKWGLTADIQSPDYEMRMALLQRKSLDEGIEIPSDIIEYIARHVKSSVRELEGALISLAAKVTLDKKPLSLELAKEVVYGFGVPEPPQLTVDNIKKIVCDYYNIAIPLVESKSRKHEIALARQMSIYLAKMLTQNSLKSIGSAFGGRDHSTVLHSCQTIENYISTDKTVKDSYLALYKKLKPE